MGSLAPGVAALMAERLFCLPQRRPLRQHERDFLATGERLDVPHLGSRLAAWRWGPAGAPTALLVHGWSSHAGRFAVLGPALVALGWRVVTYDNPAHGASPGSRSSLPQFAAALRAVADAVGGVRVAVGHSLGGAAIAVALRDGLALERAVLLAAPADPPQFAERFTEYLHIPGHVGDAMRRNLERRFRRRWADFHIPSVVAAHRTPVLVVHDEDDPDVLVGEGRAIAAAWPGAELQLTSGLGHHAVVRDPAVVARVAAFLGAPAAS
ncbi:MAG: alpha/beta fold hydrolase [Gemmatimonadales bacterium]|nr:alpha/beta fold hydrolase [Gemmatimonadales bacterium]